MAANFFFYDLETSGINPKEARIVQFAGQRTDMELQPIGEPVNVLIKLTPDVLPDPDAVLITGITPQATITDGVTEAEFLHYFYDEVVQDDTIFMGYNTVRFDDEFMRYIHYRNFYDPYEWQWCNGCSRWDLLDVVRMTRALRPEGIEWPYAPNGKPSNRLEYLTKLNKLDHQHAHDALSDVHATIAVAQLIRATQKDLFEYLLGCRQKQVVKELILNAKPFVYTSGRYPSETYHTTAAVLLAPHKQQDCALVYDLRYDPEPYIRMSVEELIEAWKWKRDSTEPRLPVKTVKYNRCPAVAPLGVMKQPAVQERLQLSLEDVEQHWRVLRAQQQPFAEKIHAALEHLDEVRERAQTSLMDDANTVDGRLYEKFFDAHDKDLMRVVRGAQPRELGALQLDFHDSRLQSLLPLYKARNFPKELTSEERAAWDAYCVHKLTDGTTHSRLYTYFARLGELAESKQLSEAQRYVLEELQLYGESIVPADVAA
ncbi:MAG TPA: exodeoxyribonuclease I [Candidatus Saccharimonadales bacterium]|nr:exodeoxyribonuclease I [Candidatus Saccharimonadales bacterium]